MPSTGAPALTIAAGAREGTLAITGCSVLALFVPAKLEGQFFKVQTSKDGGTTYFNQTVEIQGQHVVRHLIPKADEQADEGWVIVLGWPAVYDYIKVVCSSRQKYARTFYVLTDGREGTTGSLTLSLGDSGTSTSHTRTVGTACTVTDTAKAWTTNEWAGATVTLNSKTMTVASNTATVLTSTAAGWSADPGASEAAYTLYFAYPIAYIRSVKSAADRPPSMQTGGALRWDQMLGCWEFKITDFSGPLGQMRIDMESERQGHRLVEIVAPTWDGSMGYLTAVPQKTNRITPSPAIATTRAIVPTSVAICSDIEDVGGDPRWYVGVGNQVWRSVQGAPKFQDSSLPFGDLTFTDTTMTHAGETWTVNEWVGFTVTAAGQTLVVTSNTANTVTGTGTWSGTGNPPDGSGYEMHQSVLTMTGATQITGMCTAVSWSATGIRRRIYVTAASATGDHDLKYLGATGSPWEDGVGWQTAESYGSVDITAAEAVCTSTGWGYPSGGTMVNYGDLAFYADRRGRVYLHAVYVGQQSGIFFAKGRVQFLAEHFDDPVGQGISLIAGGKLQTVCWPSTARTTLRPMPDLPPLFCGCMYQNLPTVSDGGLAIYQVQGTQTRRLDLPPNLLSEYNIRNSTTYRASIRFLQSAGDLLLAGLQLTDGTNYVLMLAAYNDAVGQWRVLWAYSAGTSASDFLGSYLATAHAPANLTGADKHLMIAYKVGTNSLVDTIQMPRGLVGQTGTDDAFNTDNYWGLPDFDGGEPNLVGTMFGYRILYYASQVTTPYPRIMDAMDGEAYALLSGSLTPAVGWNSTEKLLGSGRGESFTRCAVLLGSAGGAGAHHPEIHAFSYLFLKRGPTRLLWQIPLDTQKWMRDNSKTASQLLTQLGYSRDRKTGSTAVITNVMTTDTVVLQNFELENASDPVTAPIGYTLVELEAPL